MLFTTNKISQNELENINNFFNEFDSVETVAPESLNEENNIGKYLTSLAASCYSKSVNDIANTKVGNRVVRKKNLQQVMKESFFYGSNRFGNNFIA